jgi:hypothetical protein
MNRERAIILGIIAANDRDGKISVPIMEILDHAYTHECNDYEILKELVELMRDGTIYNPAPGMVRRIL